jgi:F1F0 ATPase subunit 2
MAMNETLSLVFALLTGVVLGAVFFGGLWWTVRKGFSSNYPSLWFLGSLLLRTCLTLDGFYLVAHGHWERLLVCLLGFVAARLIVIRLTRASGDTTILGAGGQPCTLVLTK